MKTLGWPPIAPVAKNQSRVIVIDGDTSYALRLGGYLAAQGYQTQVVASLQEARSLTKVWLPDIVILHPKLQETQALSLLDFLGSRRLKKRPQVVVLQEAADHQEAQWLKHGAAKCVIKPLEISHLLGVLEEVRETARVLSPPRMKVSVGASAIKELHALSVFLKQATVSVSGDNGLHSLLSFVGRKIKGVRCSLIEFKSEELAVVLASSDDPLLKEIQLDLKMYPELEELRRISDVVSVPNVRNSKIFSMVRERLEATPFETMVLFPVYRGGVLFGALSLRLSHRHVLELFYIEKFGSICAQILSLVLSTPGQNLVPRD